MQDSLYVMRSETGNQCSILRSGLVWSCREDLRINLADVFWIFCSLCRRHSGTPARRELPWSKGYYWGFGCVLCQVLSD